ncbi:phage baseplate protein [Erwinia sp. JH02]|uniref:phage baseplate protein n=1 Tax=Erwinia sp. JH02 TaxID=2733394 RepID=UPI0014899A6D|nr:phage baseplate protein [Erwinia sp. JH02]NNS07347.1 phage baseplate protein [Erwinia sp. JH02]
MNREFSSAANQSSDADAQAFAFDRMLSGNHFIKYAQVTAVRGAAPNLVVDVLPLVAEIRNSDRTIIMGSEVFNVPVWRLQRGSSAIIMNPVVGDIGMIAVCDNDTTVARKTRKESVPGSNRKHSLSDAIYLGGIINSEPTQFIEFADSELNITSPNPVNITCSAANITAANGVLVDSPTAHFTGRVTADGDITDNAGTQSSSLKALRDDYNGHRHPVAGVQSGSSTVTSDITDKPS